MVKGVNVSKVVRGDCSFPPLRYSNSLNHFNLFNLFFLLFPLLFSTTTHAQLCTGSLGDPVVHITFGTSPGPLKAGVTNMNYVPSGCPNDGSYTIANHTSGCFSYTWHTLDDHTGDANGQFMLINASIDPSDFYVETVTGLCGNTVYEFASWAVNVLVPSACSGNGIKPNLSFRIETTKGAVLQEFSSGDIPSDPTPVWKQYGTFFTTPAGTDSVVLRIRNNSKGGCGNDLALDDITFRPCGPQVTAHADNDNSGFLDICENDPHQFVFTSTYSTGYADPVLQWQVSKDSGKTWTDIPGEQSKTFTRKPTANGYFGYRVSIAERANFQNTSCRTASNLTYINVRPAPTGPTYNSVLGCTPSNATIAAPAGPGFSYQWKGPGQFSSTASSITFQPVNYTDSGLYIVQVDAAGCSQTDSFFLKVAPAAKAVVTGGGNVCEGSGITLSASGGTSYSWQPSAGLSDTAAANPVASPADTTTYQVFIINQYGCRDSGTATVNVWKKPSANAGPDRQIFEGDTTMLNGSISGTSVDFAWMPLTNMQQSNTLTPIVSPTDNTVYTLTVTSQLGCGVATDDVTVKVYKRIKPPNAFSPNGDGINDSWIISGLETYPDATVQVFDRSGHIVFSTRSVEKIWDGRINGKPVPVGTYYYLINPATGQPPISGWVLVIR